MVMTILAIKPFILPEYSFWSVPMVISVVIGLLILAVSVKIINKGPNFTLAAFILIPVAFSPFVITTVIERNNFSNQTLPKISKYLETNYSISGLSDEDLEKLYRGAEWYDSIENAVVKTSNYGYITSVKEGQEISIIQSDYQPATTKPMEPKVQPMSSENAEESTW